LPYNKLTGYEIYQNKDKKATSGAGDAMLAGFLFGGLTALAVSNVDKTEKTTCASPELHIKLNDLSALEIFSFVGKTVYTDSQEYVEAFKRIREVASAPEHILKLNEEQNA